MIANDAWEDGFGSEAEPEAGALRSGLRMRAELVVIGSPPIPAVRQRARRRRTRRRVFQGLSGAAAACAMLAGIFAFAPGWDAGSSPAPGTVGPASVPNRAPAPLPPPGFQPPATTPVTTPVTTTADYLSASDLGAGWTGPVAMQFDIPSLQLDRDMCQKAGVYTDQVPVTPAKNKGYELTGSGKVANQVLEAVYTFAPGTGPSVMEQARAALGTGCGQPDSVKLLPAPTVADETIVFTMGGASRNILVRSGDRVASAFVGMVPAGPDGTARIDDLARRMAARLTSG